LLGLILFSPLTFLIASSVVTIDFYFNLSFYGGNGLEILFKVASDWDTLKLGEFVCKLIDYP
jgi:hypothetical protein